jgi:hypothetical protein
MTNVLMSDASAASARVAEKGLMMLAGEMVDRIPATDSFSCRRTPTPNDWSRRVMRTRSGGCEGLQRLAANAEVEMHDW